MNESNSSACEGANCVLNIFYKNMTCYALTTALYIWLCNTLDVKNVFEFALKGAACALSLLLCVVCEKDLMENHAKDRRILLLFPTFETVYDG